MLFAVTLFQSLPSLDRLTLTIGVWVILISLARSIWQTTRQGWNQLARLHQIPCYRCVFFTGDYHLKCTVYPSKALNEEAIDCLDYQPIASPPDNTSIG